MTPNKLIFIIFDGDSVVWFDEGLDVYRRRRGAQCLMLSRRLSSSQLDFSYICRIFTDVSISISVFKLLPSEALL